MSKISWQAVALTGVLGGLAVALATLADWQTGDVIAVTAVLAGISGGAIAGGAAASGVAQRVDDLHAETSAQTQTLQVIDRRTNGELDARIEAGSRAAADLVLAELREQGVIR
ncbi:hypothetical protein GCM10010112_67980 [Actinoplanes lobatus]|uniref:Holin n=1 Tax=Actinoplanes lobatus TaxID=113568 RepID=A0A7W7HFE6_9ACTN|nr:hypothetical protein [Actinoplanes lobatus]MBB4749122.1 hypothetical protein [Actinoplanes lobatus]GGN86418.1 hypothetical protein GCM10010112_67980 [Actinoplanes lobatus]GIE42780.1 hypothetical protein Alo02nite_56780 [Actinoplanes lobatus]